MKENEAAAKFALTSARRKIVLDLMPKYVLSDLVNYGAITIDEEAKILQKVDEESQVELLLQLIRQGKPNISCYEVFQKCLRIDDAFNWLADDLHSANDQYVSYVFEMNRMMTSGGVPQLSVNLFRRAEAQDELQTKISRMFENRNFGESRWVVTWGMAGCGKTMLMVSALRDPVFLHELNIRHILWLHIGQLPDDTELLRKMDILCCKMDNTYMDKSSRSVEEAAWRLRTLFTSEKYMGTLLVLDNVWDSVVIRHFDFGIRILLSTRDRGIMDEATGRWEIVDLSEHVIPKASVGQFFADGLQTEATQLPESVLSQIYDVVDGHTMALASVRSVLQRLEKSSSNLQDAIRECLTKLQRDTLHMPNNNASLKLSFEFLNDDDRDLFTDLAIFPQAVDVPSGTLALLWEMDWVDVDLKMSEFVNKSMAGLVLNGSDHKLYYIHDLYYQFLQRRCGASLPFRHRRLIERHLSKCGGRFELLSYDGYILVYLGLHLCAAEMYDRMADVFLNLKVLLRKMNVVGPADLLGDFRRYKDHITQGGKFDKKFANFQDFLRQEFDKLSTSSIDKIQVALSQPIESDVYKQALIMAKETPKHPYFVWNNRTNVKSSSIISTRHHNGAAMCAIFSNDCRFVISAGYDQIIRIWECDSGKEVIRLVGHTGQVNHLCSYFKPGEKREVILACSDDGTVRVARVSLPEPSSTDSPTKLVYISMNGLKHDESGTEQVRERRFSFDRIQPKPAPNSDTMIFKNHNSSVQCCSVNKNGLLAASIDITGVIKVWSTKDGIEYKSWQGRSQASSNDCWCDLSADGQLLVSATVDFLQLWDVSKGLTEWELEERRFAFTSCHFSPDGVTVLATLDKYVVGYSVRNGAKLFELAEPNGQILVQCASSRDGSLVAAGTQSSSVAVWSCRSKQVVAYHRDHQGQFVQSVAFEPTRLAQNFDEYRLVSSDDKGGVIIWKGTSAEKEDIPLLTQVFSVQFDNQGSPNIAAASIHNKIKVLDGWGNVIVAQNGSSKADNKITCCALSPRRDKVLYGTHSGVLMLFDVRRAIATTAPMPKYGVTGAITHCLFDSKGEVMASANERGHIVISHPLQDPIDIAAHSKSITEMRLFDNDNYLLTCSFDDTLKVWKMPVGTLQFVCQGHQRSVLCCDVREIDQVIVSGSADEQLIVWDAQNGNELMRTESQGNNVRCCKFSVGTDLLASGDDGGKIKLWQIERQYIAKAKRHASNNNGGVHIRTVQAMVTLKVGDGLTYVHDLAFSADGSRLVTCSEVIKWWSVSNLIGHKDQMAIDHVADHNVDDRVDRVGVGDDVVDSRCGSDSPSRKPDQVFYVKGSDVKRIFCSEDFRSFVTVSDAGVMYHLSRLTYL